MKNYFNILKKINSKNYLSFVKKLGRRIMSPIKLNFHRLIFKNYDDNKALFIFGEARGGTTWVMEFMQANTKSISCFEPLWGRHGTFKKIAHHFSSPFYLGVDKTNEILRNYILNISKGKKYSWRTIQFNNFKQIFRSKFVLIKMVNVNLIAPWLTKNFTDLNHKPIYIIRHPLAILYSREHYNNYNSSNEFIGNFDEKRLKSSKHPYWSYLQILNRYPYKYQRYMVEWCVRNQNFINGFYSDKVNIVYYENLVMHKEAVIDKLNLLYPKLFLYSKFKTTSKSGTTSLTSSTLEYDAQLSKWIGFFNEKELKDFEEILKEFKINIYSPYQSNIQNV